VLKCICLCFEQGMVELVFDIRCYILLYITITIYLYIYIILYYTYTIIIYYTYYIIYYLILYSPLFFYLLPSTLPNLLSSIFPITSHLFHLLSPHLNIHSILVGTYIYSYLYSIRIFIFSPSPPNFPSNLTPHVLSEWMVEVCGGD